jgi:hypothetical protein
MNEFRWLEDIVKARTPGSWVEKIPEPMTMYVPHIMTKDGHLLAQTTHHGKMREDARFIATMGTIADALLDVVRAAAALTLQDAEGGIYLGSINDPAGLRNALTALQSAKERIE